MVAHVIFVSASFQISFISLGLVGWEHGDWDFDLGLSKMQESYS